MFAFEPFGCTGIDNIISYRRNDLLDYNYTLFFDQEPINMERHQATFDQIVKYAEPLGHPDRTPDLPDGDHHFQGYSGAAASVA